MHKFQEKIFLVHIYYTTEKGYASMNSVTRRFGRIQNSRTNKKSVR